MRALAAEGVLSVNPSVILAQEGAGPKETMAVLAAARVPMVVVPENYSGEGVVERVRLVAAAAGAPERGECLAASVARNLATLAETRARITKPLRVMFVLSFNNGRPMVAGRHTAADGIVKLAGGVNAMQEFQGYKQVTDEAVTAANPDVVLVMQRSRDNISAEQLFSHAAFSLTSAAKRKAFVSMEGLYLLGFGPRTAAAARDLAAEIYPELAGPPIAALATCS
jgi:iron complex transport system substrate-binding protein